LKRQDTILIAAIVAIALAALIIPDAAHRGGAGSKGKAVIYVGDTIYKEIPLGQEQVINVEQATGRFNEVVITEDGVYVRSASCDNHDCVKQGAVTLENYKTNALNNWIVCLPNQVAIELIVEEE